MAGSGAIGMRSEEDRNLAVVMRFIDGAINGGNLDVIDETWGP
jgi:hypothetical protein